MNEIMDRALSNAMRPLVEIVRKVEAKLAGKPHFEWGIVTSIDPLRVKLDSHTTALPDRPDTLTTGLQVGDRVRVERQGTRATVHGVSHGGNTGWTTVAPAVGGGTIRWKAQAGLVEVRWQGTGPTYVAGATVLKSGLMPSEFRPISTTRGAAALNGLPTAGLAVDGGGSLVLVNSTGATRSAGEGSVLYHL